METENKLIFTIKDLNISKKFDFIVKDLKPLAFFVCISRGKINDYLENNTPLDLLCDIGYIDYSHTIKVDKYGYKDYKIQSVPYWIDILKYSVDDRKYTEKQRDIYIDFQLIFENQCVEKAKEFEEAVKKQIEIGGM